MPKRKVIAAKKTSAKRTKKELAAASPTLLDFLQKKDANATTKAAPQEQSDESNAQKSNQQQDILVECDAHKEPKDEISDKEIMAHDEELLAEINEESSDAYWEAIKDDSKAEEDDYNFPKVEPGDIKIVTYNVAGLRAALKKGLEEYIHKENPDIILLQETKVNSKVVKEKPLSTLLKKDYPFSHIVTTENGQAGVAIFSKIKYTSLNVSLPHFPSNSRFISVEYENFSLINTYVPNSSTELVNLEKRKEWDLCMWRYLNSRKEKPLIWCGDLNVANHWIDCFKAKLARNVIPGFTDAERIGFRRFLKLGFVDAYRLKYPNKRKAYTFWSFRGQSKPKDNGWYSIND